jgi:hypothetical protein
MLNPLISAYLFLVASILSFIAAVISVSNENSMDSIYLGTGLLCGLLSLAMYRKRKRSAAIHFSTQPQSKAFTIKDAHRSNNNGYHLQPTRPPE